MYFLFLFILGMFFPLAQATTMFYLNDTQQANLSDAVVIAHIGTAKTSPHPEYPTIMTETTIIVEEVLFGEAPKTLHIRQLGGTYNGKTLYIPGDAKFETGTRVVLFLNKENDTWFLTALEQSQYELEKKGRLGWILKKKYHEGLVYQNTKGHIVPYVPPIHKPFQSLTHLRSKLRAIERGAK